MIGLSVPRFGENRDFLDEIVCFQRVAQVVIVFAS